MYYNLPPLAPTNSLLTAHRAQQTSDGASLPTLRTLLLRTSRLGLLLLLLLNSLRSLGALITIGVRLQRAIGVLLLDLLVVLNFLQTEVQNVKPDMK